MSDKIGEVYTELLVKMDKFEAALTDAEKRAEVAANTIQNKFQRAKVSIDTAVFKRNIGELEAMQAKLKTKLEEKIALGADVGSITRTKNALDVVEQKLKDIKAQTSPSGSGIFGGMFQGFDGGIGSMIAGLAGAALATATVQKAFEFLHGAVEKFEARESALMGVKATLHSMGLESEYSADSMLKMAKNINEFNKYSVGADKILDLTTYLLTFDKIGKESLPRAVQIVVDLSRKMDTDLKGAALSVGIALDNPAEGLTRLGRSGVKFSKDEKDVIQALVDAGKAAEAQEMIFDKLEKKVGGFARNTVHELDEYEGKISAWIASIERSIGGLIIGVIEPAAEAMSHVVTKSAIDRFDELSKSVKNNADVVEPLISKYEALAITSGRNAEQESALSGVIAELGSMFPDAIEKWNQYGQAISISTTRIRENIQAEKDRLAYANRDAIQQTYNDQAANLEKQSRLQDDIKRKGEFKTVINGLNVKNEFIPYSAEELDRKQKEIENLGKQLKGIQAEHRRLTTGTSALTSDGKGGAGSSAKTSDDVLKERFDAERRAIEAHNKLEESRVWDDYRREIQAAENTKALKLKEVEDEAKADKKKAGDAQAMNSKRRAINDEYQMAIEAADKKHLEKIENAVKAANEAKLEYDKKYAEEQAKIGTRFVYSPKTIEEANSNFQRGLAGNPRKKREDEDPNADKKAIKEWQDDNKHMALAAQSTVSVIDSSWSSALDEWIGQGKNFSDSTVHTWTNMATQIVMQILRISAQYALMQGAKGLLSLAPGSGFLSFLVKGLGGHDGGSFVGTSSGVRRAASGADFIVPSGYPNDSYPLFVETGERVQVTKASEVGRSDNSDMVRMLQVINANLSGGGRSRTQRLDVGVVGRLDGTDIGLSGRKAMQIYNRNR
jgi:hypothetical protein